MLRYVLLALMSDGQPVHGYALMKAYEERSGIRLSIGNIYRELQGLVAAGLIAPAQNQPGADARRSPYAITEAGRTALERWFSVPAEGFVRESIDPLHYRLALLGDLDAQRVAGFLEDLHAELCSQTRELERQKRMVCTSRSDVRSMRSMLLARRARRLAADIELIEDIRRALFNEQRRTRTKSAESTTTPGKAVGRSRQAQSRGGDNVR